MKKRILFVNPPSGLFVRDDRCQSSVEDFLVAIPRPPHELLIMATILESAGHTVMVRDYPIMKKSFIEYALDLESFAPDIVVINATIPSLVKDIECAKIAKRQAFETTVVLRCGMIEPIARDVMHAEPDIDMIIYGESDFSLREILQGSTIAAVPGLFYRNGGVIEQTAARPYLQDLDSLPIVNRRLIDNNAYIRPDSGRPLGLIEVSRGCPYSCIFCLTPSTYGHGHRRRSPQSIVKEIALCVTEYGIRDFHLKSDLFSAHHEWVHELCDEIIKSGLSISWFANSRVDSVNKKLLRHMKESGCFAVSFGVESGSQEILDKMHKKITIDEIHKAFSLCKELKIETYAYFIIGFPWDTRETIEESVTLAMRIDPNYVDFFFPYVFYGTPLYDICRDMGLMHDITYTELQKGSYVAVQFPTTTLSTEELARLRKKAMQRFYLRPRFIMKTLLRCKNLRELLAVMRYGLSTFKKMVR
ncbi:MAG: radical SAM protein [Candidatus Omnitrophica bacterium]|nr:radical SAM protein [Candidatus Omnitrophota bacterium]